jgi:tetratricopeptide (TPR) repeat protein
VHSTSPCPDSALLAAFLEGHLSDYERTAVVSHLAECDQCRSVAIGVIGFQEVQALDRMWEPAPPSAGGRIPVRLTPRPRWRSNRAHAAWLLAAAAGLAAVALPLLLARGGWFDRRPVVTLVDAVEGTRTVEARVSGARYAPFVEPVPGHRSDGERSSIVNAVNRVRAAHEDDVDAAARRALGLADLLVGESDAAVVNLAVAAENAPQDAQLANDLAAAYYERSQRHQRPDDLPRALGSAQRAIAIAPHLAEAWFNRALAITALGLKAEARAAWQAYLERDRQSAWADEARTRLAGLQPAGTRRRWLELRAQLESKPDAAAAETAVRHYLSHAREYLETDLLRRWVEAPAGGDAVRLLTTMRVLAAAFQRVAGEHLYADTFAALDRAAARPQELGGFVAAHREMLAMMALPVAGLNTKDAVPRMTRIAERLAAVGSPLALRAQIELAGAHYYAHAYAKAAEVIAVKARAQSARYPVLVMRAAWVQGLTAFARNDFAQARSAYEERLALAVAASDVDQTVSSRILLGNLHDVLGNAALAWEHRVAAASAVEDVYSPSLPVALLLSSAGDLSTTGDHAAAHVFEASLLSLDLPLSLPTAVQARAQHARTLFQLGFENEADQQRGIARQILGQIEDSNVLARVEADVLIADAYVLQNRNPDAAAAAAERALAILSVEREPLRVAGVHAVQAQSLIAGGHVERAEAAVRAGVLALEQARQLPQSESAIASNHAAWGIYDAALGIALSRGNLSQAFEYSERRRLRTVFERRHWGQRVVSFEQLRDAVAPDTAVVILNQVGAQLHIWMVRNGELYRHQASVTPARAVSLIAAQHEEMARGSSSRRTSGELYDLILAPLADRLDGVKHLVVVADAPYNRIGFAGLWDKSTDRYLVERLAVVAAPSATGFVSALGRARAAIARHTSAAVFDAVDAAGQARPASIPLDEFYDVTGRHHGAKATPAQLLAEVGARDVVHVAAPVVTNAEYPDWSRVLLADSPSQKYSGAVFASEMANTRTPQARLVALEGASRGGSAAAEGALGFVSALLVAGVPNIVGPIAHLDTASVERTWLEFHRLYASRLSAAESLRQAQLSALRESNHRPGPWAMLTVFGSTQ